MQILFLDKLCYNFFSLKIRSKQLIKDAIMDNDFLKHLDSIQIRELVDSMYSRDVESGEYVVREGDPGKNLFVSAEGEFEVIVGGKMLGVMGPKKAFGELAILYNCTRTASVKGEICSILLKTDFFLINFFFLI